MKEPSRPVSTAPRPRPSRWLRRAAAAASALTVLAYALIPWYVPTAWLARRIALTMSRNLSRPVRIEQLTLSWKTGVRIDGLTIDELPGEDRPPRLLQIDHVRCGLTPLRTLWTDNVDRLELDGVQAWVSILPGGRLNIDDVNGRLPTSHIVLKNAVLHLELPRLAAQCRMDRMECRINPRTGVVGLEGDAALRPRNPGRIDNAQAQPSGRFLINGQLNVPRLKKDVVLAGGGELRWENVAMEQMPFHLFPRLTIDSVEGRTDGYIRLEAQPDLGVDFEVRMRLDGVVVRRTGRAEPEQIQDGLFRAAGHWDPAVDRVVARKLDYEMSALRVRDTGDPGRPAVVLDQRSSETLRLDLIGEVNDLSRLRRQFPSMDEVLQECGLRTTDRCAFTLYAARSAAGDRTRIVVDATPASLMCPNRIRLGAGVAKRISLDIFRARDAERLDIRDSRVDIDDLHLHLDASVPSHTDAVGADFASLAGMLHGGMVKLRLHTDHCEQLDAYFPVVGRMLGPAPRRGPLELSAVVEPASHRSATGPAGQRPASFPGMSAVAIRLASPGGAELHISNLLHKPAGLPLTAEASALWDGKVCGRWQDIAVAVTLGRSRIELGPDATVDCSTEEAAQLPSAPDETDLLVQAHLPLRLTGLEHMAPLLPLLTAQMQRAARTSVTCRGQALLTVDASVRYRAKQMEWRSTLAADLTAAGLSVGTVLDKPVGDHASVSVVDRFLCSREHAQRETVVRLVLPGIASRAQYYVAGLPGRRFPGPLTDEESLSLEIDVGNASRAIDSFPMLARLLADCRVSGRASLTLRAARSSTGTAMNAELDAGGLALLRPQAPSLRKAAGAPCRFALRARNDAGRPDRWRLDIDEIRFAAAQLHTATLDIAITPAWAGWLDGIAGNRSWTPPPDAAAWTRLEFKGRAEAGVDDAIRESTPAVADRIARLGLTGRLEGDVQLVATPAAFRVVADFDATTAAFDAALPDGTRFTKAAGLAASAKIDLERRIEGAAQSFLMHEAVLTAGRNRLDLTGAVNARATADRAAPLELHEGRLQIHAHITRLDQLQSHFPDRAWPAVRGQVALDADLNFHGGKWSIGSCAITADAVALDTDDVPVRIDGRARYDHNRLFLDSLLFRAGTSEGTISGRALLSADRLDMQFGAHARRLDVDELDRLHQILQKKLPELHRRGDAPNGPVIWAALRRGAFDARAQIDRLQLTLPDLDVRTDVAVATMAVSGRAGMVEIPFRASVDGGLIDGTIKFVLDGPEPYFDLSYTAENLAPEALAQAYLRRSFPGFVPTGPLTLIDRSLQPLETPPGQTSHPVGSGELIVEGGYVKGKAAPDWLTRIFPGLNLAEYQFLRMHNWFTKHADGRVENRIIFLGPYYHLYMDGCTAADRTIRYEVGIDLLARWDSRYWAETKQGRIPLFIKTGRLALDGTLESDVVEYRPMRAIIEMLVRNNVLTTIYNTIRRQVLRPAP